MRRYFPFSVYVILFIAGWNSRTVAQPASANVLYSDHPQPIRIGIDAGVTITPFLNATPTYFATNYPYADIPDTIHMRFPDGASAGVGYTIGAAADFGIADDWGILAKINYSLLRAGWHSVSMEQGVTDRDYVIVPVTNDLQLTLRYLNVDLMLRHSFRSLKYFYLGAGFEYGQLLSNNYAITQSLGGPTNLSFVNFSTGQGTGIRSYTLSNSFNNTFATSRFAIKLLAGFPIRIGHRWTLNPEASAAFPLNQLFNTSARADYQANGFSATPNPLLITLTIGLRYEL